MQTILATIIAVFAATFIYAQTSDAETDALVNLLGVQKREAMGRLVNVTAKDSVAFWKIYDRISQQSFWSRFGAKEILCTLKSSGHLHKHIWLIDVIICGEKREKNSCLRV